MKKGLKFTKEQLENLYLKQKLSLTQIGKKFDCENTNILYWLKKFDIKRRPAKNPNSVYISKEVLEDLYWNKNWTTQQIADKFGIRYGRSVLKKFKRLGIPSKTLSQANSTKFKADFSNNPKERAYLLGLRAGDFHVRLMKQIVRVQTTTTHSAQLNLLKNSFEKYGEIKKYLSKNKARHDEWFIYADLNQSFTFLIEKPNKIPSWILNNDKYFYQFLAAYIDCEGNWHFTKSHEIHPRFTFRLRTGDRLILQDIKQKLESREYITVFSLERKKGSMGPNAPFRKDIYNLTINRKKDIIRLIKILLPLSKHSEKIRKMKFILNNKDKKWHEIEPGWNNLRQEIKGELLKNGQNGV